MPKSPKFLLIIAVVGGTPFGTPAVVSFEAFEKAHEESADEKSGNSGFRVLAEISEDFQVTSKTVSECDSERCTYYTHYLVYYNREVNGERLEHAPFHAAEERCEFAQNRYQKWLDENEGDELAVPDYLERQAKYWENKICA